MFVRMCKVLVLLLAVAEGTAFDVAGESVSPLCKWFSSICSLGRGETRCDHSSEVNICNGTVVDMKTIPRDPPGLVSSDVLYALGMYGRAAVYEQSNRTMPMHVDTVVNELRKEYGGTWKCVYDYHYICFSEAGETAAMGGSSTYGRPHSSGRRVRERELESEYEYWYHTHTTVYNAPPEGSFGYLDYDYASYHATQDPNCNVNIYAHDWANNKNAVDSQCIYSVKYPSSNGSPQLSLDNKPNAGYMTKGKVTFKKSCTDVLNMYGGVSLYTLGSYRNFTFGSVTQYGFLDVEFPPHSCI